MSATTLKHRKLADFYAESIENASDVLAKLTFLKDFSPANGLSIKRYPMGTPLELIKKIQRAIESFGALSKMGHHVINGRKNIEFVLTRSGSEEHLKFQRSYIESGGIHSPRIHDHGEFQIVEVVNGFIEHGDNFNLYSISDHYLVQ